MTTNKDYILKHNNKDYVFQKGTYKTVTNFIYRKGSNPFDLRDINDNYLGGNGYAGTLINQFDVGINNYTYKYKVTKSHVICNNPSFNLDNIELRAADHWAVYLNNPIKVKLERGKISSRISYIKIYFKNSHYNKIAIYGTDMLEPSVIEIPMNEPYDPDGISNIDIYYVTENYKGYIKVLGTINNGKKQELEMWQPPTNDGIFTVYNLAYDDNAWVYSSSSIGYYLNSNTSKHEAGFEVVKDEDTFIPELPYPLKINTQYYNDFEDEVVLECNTTREFDKIKSYILKRKVN